MAWSFFDPKNGYAESIIPLFDQKNGHAKLIILLFELKNGHAKRYDLLFDLKNDHVKRHIGYFCRGVLHTPHKDTLKSGVWSEIQVHVGRIQYAPTLTEERVYF